MHNRNVAARQQPGRLQSMQVANAIAHDSGLRMLDCMFVLNLVPRARISWPREIGSCYNLFVLLYILVVLKFENTVPLIEGYIMTHR